MTTQPLVGKGFYDELWSERWGDLQRYGPVSRHQRRLLAEMLQGLEVGSILDVGCGGGNNLAWMGVLFRGARRTGVDVSAEAVARARGLNPAAAFQVGLLQDLPHPGEGHDLVMSIDVLEHVDDDVGLLAEMVRRSTRYVLAVSVQGRMRPSERAIGHVRNYRRGELADKMRSVGLAVKREVCWGFPFYSPLFRTFVESTGTTSISMGTYGPSKRLLCEALYRLFSLNSSRWGDKVFVLAERA